MIGMRPFYNEGVTQHPGGPDRCPADATPGATPDTTPDTTSRCPADARSGPARPRPGPTSASDSLANRP